MGSFLIVLALVIFALGELANVIQKNRNRRADRTADAESVRDEDTDSGERENTMRKRHARNKAGMLAVALAIFLISVLVIANALSLSLQHPKVVVEKDDSGAVISYQIVPSRDPRRVFALPFVLMIGGAALAFFVRRYRAEVKEWEETSSEEDVPVVPAQEKRDLPPDAAQKKREELAHLLEAGLLTKDEYRERLKKLE